MKKQTTKTQQKHQWKNRKNINEKQIKNSNETTK